MSKRLILATRNKGKILEIKDLMMELPLELLTYEDIRDWPALEERGHTFEENAASKASVLAERSGLPSLADDSGLEVDALGGEPGVMSARFAGRQGDDAANIARLLRELAGVPAGERGARFVCVLCLADQAGNTFEVREICEGSIAGDPRGEGGFGYDPVFLPQGMEVTMAELTREEKNAISHRGKALRRLRFLFERGEPAWLWEQT